MRREFCLVKSKDTSSLLSLSSSTPFPFCYIRIWTCESAKRQRRRRPKPSNSTKFQFLNEAARPERREEEPPQARERRPPLHLSLFRSKEDEEADDDEEEEKASQRETRNLFVSVFVNGCSRKSGQLPFFENGLPFSLSPSPVRFGQRRNVRAFKYKFQSEPRGKTACFWTLFLLPDPRISSNR